MPIPTPVYSPVEWTSPLRLVNPWIIDARRNNLSGQKYADVAEVLSQNPIGSRGIGQIYNVSDPVYGILEYWFKDGINDEDLVLRTDPKTISSLYANSIEDLRLTENASIGDTVNVLSYHEGLDLGGGTFEAKFNAEEYVHFDSLLLQEARGTTGISIPLTTSDKIVYRFRIPTQPSVAYTAMFKGAFELRIHHNLNSNYGGDYTINLAAGSNDGILESLVDDYGTETNLLGLKFDTWYTAIISPTLADTITKIYFAKPFASYFTFDLSNFSVGDENFIVSNTGGIVGDKGSFIPYINSPSIQHKDYDDGFEFIQTANNIVFKKIINGTSVDITEFGAKPANSLTDFSFDNSPYIQKAIDSKYNPVTIPALKFNIDSEIQIKKPKTIDMCGIFRLTNTNSNFDLVNYENDTSSTYLFSQNNINFIRIQYGNIIINQGVLYTASITNHDKAGIIFDYNFALWYGEFNNVVVIGKESDLLTTGIGTKAFHFDTENIYQGGYFHNIHITGAAIWCAYGVLHGDASDDSTSSNWSNSNTFWLTSTGCKVFYNVSSGNALVKGIQQARSVRNAEEAASLYGISVKRGICEAHIVDALDNSNDVANGKYRFSQKNTYVNVASGSSIADYLTRQYLIRGIHTDNLVPNQARMIGNTSQMMLSERNAFISDLQNTSKFLGDYGNASIKGYKADNSDWFAVNLYPADDLSNTTPLTQDVSVEVVNADRFLISGKFRNYSVTSKITNPVDTELYFTEISLDTTIFNSNIGKLEKLFLVAKPVNTSLQVIIHHGAGIWTKTVDVGYNGNYPQQTWEFNNRSYDFGSINSVSKIIFRLIGSIDVTESTVINEVSTRFQYRGFEPYLSSSGDQNLNGFLSLHGIKPRTQTWAEIVALKAAGTLYVGNTFIVSDMSNKQITISGQSIDGNYWYKEVDNYGNETIRKVQ